MLAGSAKIDEEVVKYLCTNISTLQSSIACSKGTTPTYYIKVNLTGHTVRLLGFPEGLTPVITGAKDPKLAGNADDSTCINPTEGGCTNRLLNKSLDTI